jgi:hypothetical protein
VTHEGAELEQRNTDVMGETLEKQYSVLFREVAALHCTGTNLLRFSRLGTIGLHVSIKPLAPRSAI